MPTLTGSRKASEAPQHPEMFRGAVRGTCRAPSCSRSPRPSGRCVRSSALSHRGDGDSRAFRVARPINEVLKATAANSNSPIAARCPPRAGDGGLAAPESRGCLSIESPPPREQRGEGSGSSPSRECLATAVPVPHAGCPSPPPALPRGRSAARDAMLAAGRRRRGHLHGLKAKRLRPSVLFLAGSSGQRSAAPLRRRGGRGGRRGRTEPAGRADGRGTGGARLPQASRSQAGCGAPPAPAPAAASRERLGKARRDRQRPPASPRCGCGSPRAGDSLPGFSPAAAAARRGPADGQSWAGAGRGSASSRAPPA